MSDQESFADLIQRVRNGDQAAATELVTRYEPNIRRAIRIQMRDGRLRRLLDSMDICQSVLASFFIRAHLGQYELKSPENLVALLMTMARHKLADQARKPQVKRREERNLDSGEAGEEAADDSMTDPMRQAEQRDLVAEVRKRLSEEECQLADLRGNGKEWAEIATLLGGSAEALRKKLERAINRAAREMGLDALG
jgi:RNA polymerase sigma-70 factor (ECF subfamily)